MKKLLLSSIVLLIFACSIVIFQMSCKKDVQAQAAPATTTTQIGKVIYGKSTNDTKVNFTSYQVWIANYDGSGQQQVNIPLPANYYIDEPAKISPDGKTIFFTAEYYLKGSTISEFRIYSCNADGTGLKQILTDVNYISVGNAY